MKFLLRKLIVFFLLFFCFFIQNSFWQDTSIQEKNRIEAMNKFYEQNKESVDKVFESKDEFEQFYKNNYNYSISKDWIDVNRNILIKAEEINNKNKKEENEKNNAQSWNSWSNSSETWRHIKNILAEWDSNFVLEMLFWTSDQNVLEKAWILPSRNSWFHKTVLNIYNALFNFFVFVWWMLIILFIYHLIIDWKSLFKKWEWWRRWKFEDIIIWFIVVVVVIYWWIRLYIMILVSWMNDIKEDLNTIWIDTDKIQIEHLLEDWRKDLNNLIK